MLKRITLESELIKLEPITMAHLSDFCKAGNFAEVWRYMQSNPCEHIEITRTWISYMIDEMDTGSQIAFVIINKQSNKIVGSTRLFRVNEVDRALEIGHTFISPEFQRSHVNSHAKYLLLEYVFETLDFTRVEICTHENNLQSRRAIARIGGQFEGILRKNRCAEDGSYRNTALFSIINNEWPQVKANLLKTGQCKEVFSYVSN
ncbi:GNAT family N-acetyltransferase [Moritella sp. 5]|uniref:GNAT family N-acetyltransferase n=1 Tax=Moritella sp. 5 TaxID=2746231 RepID=UPI001BA44E5B|nr:GNAT family protein [Moritella sp. 5]QUM80258.1 GNAT family N-acetyltransferase [Moritella sp. 5]